MKARSWTLAFAALLSGALFRGTLAAEAPESLRSRDFAAEVVSASASLDLKAIQTLRERSRVAVQSLDSSSQPDWSFTPGRLCTPQNPNFDEYRYPEQIPHCKRHVTQGMKRQVAEHYGIPQSEWSSYEFDHLIPLAIGGGSDIDNLWPQPRGSQGDAEEKDKFEYRLYLQIRDGKITQADAVRQVYAWFGRHPELRRFIPPAFAAAK